MFASAFNWSDFFLCDFSSVSAENLQRKKPNRFFALAFAFFGGVARGC
jgi:hypothetical protein